MSPWRDSYPHAQKYVKSKEYMYLVDGNRMVTVSSKAYEPIQPIFRHHLSVHIWLRPEEWYC